MTKWHTQQGRYLAHLTTSVTNTHHKVCPVRNNLLWHNNFHALVLGQKTFPTLLARPDQPKPATRNPLRPLQPIRKCLVNHNFQNTVRRHARPPGTAATKPQRRNTLRRIKPPPETRCAPYNVETSKPPKLLKRNGLITHSRPPGRAKSVLPQQTAIRRNATGHQRPGTKWNSRPHRTTLAHNETRHAAYEMCCHCTEFGGLADRHLRPSSQCPDRPLPARLSTPRETCCAPTDFGSKQ